MTSASCVFVVDDDPSARRGLARLLRTVGHDVRDFDSADQFLDAFDPDTSGCLVLDARMPGLSGEHFRAELNARDIRLPIIVITADDNPVTRQEAQRMKAEGFFRKPVDGIALLDAVKWALEQDQGD